MKITDLLKEGTGDKQGVAEGSRYNADGSPKNVGLKAARKFGKKADWNATLKQFAKGAATDDLSKFKDDKKEQGVAEGYTEEQYRKYGEFSESDIERWAQKSPENKKIYDAYVRVNQMAKKAWEENDGGLYTGLQVRRKQIRDLIGKQMFGQQGVEEGSLNEGQYEMMMRNGQVKKFIAKDDADAKRIAAGHGAKSVIKLKGDVPAGKIAEQDVMEGTNDIVNSLTNLRATVKQILTGRAEYPQGFASQLEVALYDAINVLRDSPEQGALDTVNELSELRAIAKQVQTGKDKFPQGYTGRLERVLYDAIKQIENVSQDMMEGDEFDDEPENVSDPDSDKIPNLVMQFRKAIDVDGNHPIIFKDGKKAKLPVATMVNFLEKYAQLKPADRELMQDVAIQSLDKLKEIVMTFKGSKAPSSIYTK